MDPEYADALREAHETEGLATIFLELYRNDEKRYRIDRAANQWNMYGAGAYRERMSGQELLAAARERLKIRLEIMNGPDAHLRGLIREASHNLLRAQNEFDRVLAALSRGVDAGFDGARLAQTADDLLLRASALATAIADECERLRCAAYERDTQQAS